MTPDELCHCKHERAYHDACSLCFCPWFLTPTNKGARKRWDADRRRREAREKV